MYDEVLNYLVFSLVQVLSLVQGLVHGYFTKKTWNSPSFVLDTTFSSEILAGERRIG